MSNAPGSEIQTLAEWEELLQLSRQKPVLLLKHSTACPISAGAWKQFQSHLQHADPRIEYRFVKVIESRPVSNRIAEDLQVQHESPQAIFIKNGQAVWHDSHLAITVEKLEEVLSSWI